MGKLISRTGLKPARAVLGMHVTLHRTLATARRIAPASLAVVLLGGGAAGWSAASANAQIRPDVRTVTLDFRDGGNHSYACNEGMTWNVNAVVEEAHNGCTTRVWLHFSTLPAFCISPLHSSATPNTQPAKNAFISSNQANCQLS
jgi:hypothetical protein